MEVFTASRSRKSLGWLITCEMEQTTHRHDSLLAPMTWKYYRRMFLLGQDQECAETQAGPPVSVGSVWCSVVLPRQQWGQPHEAVTSGSPAPPSRHRQLTPATGDTELVFCLYLVTALTFFLSFFLFTTIALSFTHRGASMSFMDIS